MNRAPSRLVGFKYLYIPYNGQPHSPQGNAWDERGVLTACCRYIAEEREPQSHCSVFPNEDCGCGIYGAFDLSRCNQHDDWCRVLFLIEGFGRSIVSVNGFRSELARIVYVVETPWGVVDYEKIAVFPPLPRISLETAVMTIYDHRIQWLSLYEGAKSSLSVVPPFAVRRRLKLESADVSRA